MTIYYDHETMLNNILDWASTKSEFDDSTFKGIKDYYEERGQFTSRQEDAIENVYFKWKIDKKYGSCEYSTKKPKKEEIILMTIHTANYGVVVNVLHMEVMEQYMLVMIVIYHVQVVVVVLTPININYKIYFFCLSK